MLSRKIKLFLLFLGDLAVFLTVFSLNNGLSFSFFIVFIVWFLLFFISRLYELPYLCNKKSFFLRFIKLSILGFIISSLFFYCNWISFISPKTFYFAILLWIVLLLGWRVLFNQLLLFSLTPVLILCSPPERKHLEDFIQHKPQVGYYLIEKKDLSAAKKNILIVGGSQKEKEQIKKINNKVRFITFIDFYESVTQTIPLSQVNEGFFQKFYQKRNFYEFSKRVFDLIGGIILFLISLPLWIVISCLIKITSPNGPVIYSSSRVGQGGRSFIIYKFRTMIPHADKLGPAWTVKNDKRITPFGRFLRFTHLDEVPQVINIIKGDTSFVGPRPEESRLVELFTQKIPFYQKRFLIKPGIIGWAQINYPHGSSVTDARKKLSFDFYYLKHRSFLFDLLIALKAWRIPFEIPTH